MKTKVTLDKKGIEKHVRDVASAAAQSMTFNQECPHCHRQIQVQAGSNTCQHCLKLVDVKVVSE